MFNFGDYLNRTCSTTIRDVHPTDVDRIGDFEHHLASTL